MQFELTKEYLESLSGAIAHENIDWIKTNVFKSVTLLVRNHSGPIHVEICVVVCVAIDPHFQVISIHEMVQWSLESTVNV